ncbi:MAG: hypothetical protein ABSH08_13245 [Tepidisphaeraceae bacterium]|jgi:hypothetical protein
MAFALDKKSRKRARKRAKRLADLADKFERERKTSAEWIAMIRESAVSATKFALRKKRRRKLPPSAR